jgi:hypothetical protein
MMNSFNPPVITSDYQMSQDREHLNLLAIFHFVAAGLGLFGLSFLALHYFMMHTIFMNPNMWKTAKNPMPPPQAFMDIFYWFYIFFGTFLVVGLVLNALSGMFLLQRRHRMFSLFVGGVNCLHVPLGTVLGVFTILALSRESVRAAYEPGKLG